MAVTRLDKRPGHRAEYERNKKIIMQTQNICGICGKPVDMSLKYGDPLAPCIDHIIPIAKGGHPSDIENLQLAHWTCNRAKSDKIFKNTETKPKEIIGNRNLPQSCDWKIYRAKSTGQ